MGRSEYDDDDDDDDDDNDSVGSLVDFVVEDEEEGTTESAPEQSGPVNDLDGIDSSNIITGKRKRRQTQFYDRAVFASADYRRMILEDIPPEEIQYALGADESNEEAPEDATAASDDEEYEDEDSESEDDTHSEGVSDVDTECEEEGKK